MSKQSFENCSNGCDNGCYNEFPLEHEFFECRNGLSFDGNVAVVQHVQWLRSPATGEDTAACVPLWLL